MTELIQQQKSKIASLNKTRSLFQKIKTYSSLASIAVFVLAVVFMFIARKVGVSLLVLTLVNVGILVGLVIADFVFGKIISKHEDENRRTVYSFEHPDRVLGESNKVSIFKRALNATKHFLSKPSNIILLVFAVMLVAMVILPLGKLVLSSMQVHGRTEAQGLNEEWGEIHSGKFKDKDWTLWLWPYLIFPASVENQAWSKAMFWTPLGESVLMSLLACSIAIIIGGVFAWLITRSNMPFKKFISTVFIFPYIMPSWSIAMFWENFFKNTSCPSSPGVGMLQSITKAMHIGANGICVPVQVVYGLVPCAIVLGLHYAPFAYILIGGILRNMDANLEEAATILKASKFKILYRITLPIIAPAMISTILLVFSSSLSTFTVPEKLHFQAISISIRGFLSSVGQHSFGYVIAVVLMIFSILILTINNWFTKSRRNFTTVSGKSGQITKANLGKVGKWVIAVISSIFVTFFSIIPLISFILESLEENTGDIRTITGQYWFSKTDIDEFVSNRGYPTKGVFFNKTIWSSFGRSAIVAVSVALLAGTFGILIGYAVSKNRRSKLANFVSSVAFLPYLIPALSFGAVYFSLAKSEAFSFLDIASTQKEASAVAICILIGMVKFLPFASRTGTNAMLQVSGEIEEAAIITGCPWWKRMVRILFPIQKSSFISGYLLPFISCMREYTLFVLVTSTVSLITNTLQYYSSYGLSQFANAINLLIVVFVIVANFAVNALTGASIDKGIGG